MTTTTEQRPADTSSVDHFVQQKYKHGFVTDIESETVPPGLNEDVVRWISARKGEPAWLLEWRLEAYRRWLDMTPPDWAHLKIDPIDFQAISYFSAPKKNDLQSLDEVDPEILATYEKLGIPLEEQKILAGVAVDAEKVRGVAIFKFGQRFVNHRCPLFMHHGGVLVFRHQANNAADGGQHDLAAHGGTQEVLVFGLLTVAAQVTASLFQGFLQAFGAYGFDHVVDGLDLEGFQRLVLVGRAENDRGRGAALLQHAGQRHAVHARH